MIGKLAFFILTCLFITQNCFSGGLLQDQGAIGDETLLKSDAEAAPKIRLIEELFEKFITRDDFNRIMAGHIKATMLNFPEDCKQKYANLNSFESALWSNDGNQINTEIDAVLNADNAFIKAKNLSHFFAMQLSLKELRELSALPKDKAVSVLMRTALLELFIRLNTKHFNVVGKIVTNNLCKEAGE